MISEKTIGQAINQIKYHKRDYEELLTNERKEIVKTRLQDIVKNYDVAIEALEKQNELKEVTIATYCGINMFGDSEYQCDKCGGMNLLSDFDYCPHCGSRIEKE